MKILLAEDDPNLGALVKEYLQVKGYETHLFPNGEAAFKAFKGENWNLCILDVMMPLMDGFQLAKEIRRQDKEIPIIFLTAKSMKDDAIEGFKSGGDDYVTKPFSMEELLLRMKAILKRTERNTGQLEEPKEFKIGRYTFNVIRQELIFGNDIQKLTSKEVELLKLLCLNMNDVLERNLALKLIWNGENMYSARSMDVYIARLRKYFVNDKNISILNAHGKGFKLLVDEP